MWFVGSRAKGEAKPDSDLGIAVSVRLKPQGISTRDIWADHHERWRAELATHLPDVKIDLQRANKDCETVRGGVGSYGMLVYAGRSSIS